MRTIKFRAWDIAKQKMIVEPRLENIKGVNLNDWFDEDATGMIFMQFTGLKDKNGKEIYEGDIVKCEQIMALVKYVVEPAIAGFVFDQDNCGAYREYAVKDGTAIHYEVIGNIYENPELLK